MQAVDLFESHQYWDQIEMRKEETHGVDFILMNLSVQLLSNFAKTRSILNGVSTSPTRIIHDIERNRVVVGHWRTRDC